MKLRIRDYIKTIIDMLLVRPSKEFIKTTQYQIELGGENGLKINGAPGYWGRYASLDKIAELAKQVKDEESNFSISYPAPEYDLKYYHMINIWPSDQVDHVSMEIIRAPDQCGSYFKEVDLKSIKIEIDNFYYSTQKPEKYGFKYVEH